MTKTSGSRVDFGDLILGWALLALTCALPVKHFVELVVRWIGGEPLVVRTIARVEPPPVADPALVDGVSGRYTGEAMFIVQNASLGQRLASLAMPLVGVVVAVLCARLVIGVARELGRGGWFTARGRARCRGLATEIIWRRGQHLEAEAEGLV